MRYEVQVGGRRRQVSVEREGDGFAVSVDGRAWQVDAVRIDAQTLSLVVDTPHQKATGGDGSGVERAARSFEVTVAPDPGSGQLAVRVGSVRVLVGINADGADRARRRAAGGDDGAHAGGGPLRVAAPMPGKIVRVLVQAGEAIRARQPLVVVEAMKMENELRAGRDGTVADVLAKEGQSVEAGALLVVIQ